MCPAFVLSFLPSVQSPFIVHRRAPGIISLCLSLAPSGSNSFSPPPISCFVLVRPVRSVSVAAASHVAAGGARLRRPRPRWDFVLPVMLATDPCRQRGLFSSRRCTGSVDLRAHHRHPAVDCARLGLVTRSFSRSDRSSWALSSRLRNLRGVFGKQERLV